MKKILKVLALLQCTVFFISCVTSNRRPPILIADQVKTELKVIRLDHKYFLIFYDQDRNIAKWTKYELRKEDLNGVGVRLSKFKQDPLLLKLGLKAIRHEDYTNSGYVRGHLVPAEDLSRSQDAIETTFVMSNVIPQAGVINSGAWAQLEKKVRSWACGEGSITVYTGPILDANMEELSSGVPIPKKFFKIIIDNTPPQKAIAFIYDQITKGQKIENRIVLPDEIQFINEIIEHRSVKFSNLSQINEWKECSL